MLLFAASTISFIVLRSCATTLSHKTVSISPDLSSRENDRASKFKQGLFLGSSLLQSSFLQQGEKSVGHDEEWPKNSSVILS